MNDQRPSITTTDSGVAPQAQSIVALDAVTVKIDGRVILRDFTLRLSDRRVGVIGRNGSGKTTLARLICGLLTPDAGHVTVNGVAVATDRKRALDEIGIIFQNPDHQIIFPTVIEEIAFGLRQQGQQKQEARRNALAVLASAGHLDWAERSVSTLSQGQRHLVCLMAVLAMRPRVVVLDEPFSGLDIPTTRWLRRTLDAALPMLIQISHDASAFDGYDRVIWIEAGQVAMDGPPEDVLAAYAAAMNAEGSVDAGADL